MPISVGIGELLLKLSQEKTPYGSVSERLEKYISAAEGHKRHYRQVAALYLSCATYTEVAKGGVLMTYNALHGITSEFKDGRKICVPLYHQSDNDLAMRVFNPAEPNYFLGNGRSVCSILYQTSRRPHLLPLWKAQFGDTLPSCFVIRALRLHYLMDKCGWSREQVWSLYASHSAISFETYFKASRQRVAEETLNGMAKTKSYTEEGYQ